MNGAATLKSMRLRRLNVVLVVVVALVLCSSFVRSEDDAQCYCMLPTLTDDVVSSTPMDKDCDGSWGAWSACASGQANQEFHGEQRIKAATVPIVPPLHRPNSALPIKIVLVTGCMGLHAQVVSKPGVSR